MKGCTEKYILGAGDWGRGAGGIVYRVCSFLETQSSGENHKTSSSSAVKLGGKASLGSLPVASLEWAGCHRGQGCVQRGTMVCALTRWPVPPLVTAASVVLGRRVDTSQSPCPRPWRAGGKGPQWCSGGKTRCQVTLPPEPTRMGAEGKGQAAVISRRPTFPPQNHCNVIFGKIWCFGLF